MLTKRGLVLLALFICLKMTHLEADMKKPIHAFVLIALLISMAQAQSTWDKIKSLAQDYGLAGQLAL